MKSSAYRTILLSIVLAIIPLMTEGRTREIKGKVLDTNGSPVSGAVVMVSELDNIGVSTSANGNFVLVLTDEQQSLARTLVATCLGMKDETVPIPANTDHVDFVLSEDLTTLQESVVIGYGQVKRKDLTGSVVTVSDKQFNKGVATSATDLIAGKVAGLLVTKVGGDPTTGASIRLRGATSLLGDSSPLIVVDGVPGASLNIISPEAIESVSVLKDASASAIYGARSANGVIIITTKKGSEGKMSVSYNGYYGVEKAARLLNLMNADEWRSYVKEHQMTGAVDYGANTDWQNAVLRLGQNQSHSVSLSGGTSKTQYRACVTYLGQKGVVITNDLRRINADVSIVQRAIDDRLTANFSLMDTFEDWTDVSTGIWSYVYDLLPTMPVRNSDGSYFQPYSSAFNPVSELEQQNNDKSRNFAQGRLALDFKILPYLSIGASGSLSRNNFLSGYYIPSTAESGRATSGYASRNTDVSNMMLFEANIAFDNTYGKHKVNCIAGYSWQKYIDEGFRASNRDFTTDLFTYNSLNSGNDLRPDDVVSYKASSKLISFYGRANYEYDDRYLFTATVRGDGSSKFGANNKWGVFPSGSIAWRLSSEDFMKGVQWMDDLKIRASYGITGNQDIGNYKSIAIYGASGFYYNEGEFYPQYAPTQNENPNLRWEKTAQLNIGIDYSFFNGRLYGAVEFYNKHTSDLLYNYDVPVPPYQYSSMLANVGEVSNTGLELTVSGTPVQVGGFRWDASINFATNRNILLSLSNDIYTRDKVYLGPYSITGLAETTTILEPGKPLGTFYGAKYVGTDEDGIFLYDDVSGDGKFVYTDDRTYIGCAQPDFTVNFSSNFSYKNFFLSFLLRGVFGNDVINGSSLYLNDIARLPGQNVLMSALNKPAQSMVYSSYYVEDGSFVRLDNIQFGYDFKFKETSKVKSLRLTLSGNNLFLITKYTGIDPEVSQNGLVFGIEARNYYPKTRAVTLGLNVSF